MVEYAPYQKVPLGKKAKKDAKADTIDEDPDFKAFLDNLKSEEELQQDTPATLLEEIERKEKEDKEKESSTHLLQFVKEKNMEKQRIRDEKRDARKKREDERRKARDEERRKRREAQKAEISKNAARKSGKDAKDESASQEGGNKSKEKKDNNREKGKENRKGRDRGKGQQKSSSQSELDKTDASNDTSRDEPSGSKPDKIQREEKKSKYAGWNGNRKYFFTLFKYFSILDKRRERAERRKEAREKAAASGGSSNVNQHSDIPSVDELEEADAEMTSPDQKPVKPGPPPKKELTEEEEANIKEQKRARREQRERERLEKRKNKVIKFNFQY